MTYRRRIRQLSHFFTPRSLPELSVWPRPWDARGTLRYPISNPLSNPDGFGGYTDENRFDAAGVPYTHTDERDLYDPLVVARFAIRMRALAVERSDPQAAQRAQAALAPLVNSVEPTGAWGRGASRDAMRSDRPSGMVQGIGISALLRLVEGRPPERVRLAIERAFDRLARPITSGGTISSLDGGAFIEEYPSDPPSHVLNGAIYALIGLYDMEDTLAHVRAAALAREVERTIERALPRFTAPMDWSHYALCLDGRTVLASAHYQNIHVAGLRVLYARTGREAFARWADRWQAALRSGWHRIPMGLIKAAESMAARRQHPIAVLKA